MKRTNKIFVVLIAAVIVLSVGSHTAYSETIKEFTGIRYPGDLDVSKDGSVWIADYYQFAMFSPLSGTFWFYDSGGMNLSGMKVSSDGTVWSCDFSYYSRGIIGFDPSTGRTWGQFPGYNTPSPFIPRDLDISRDGKIWFITDGYFGTAYLGYLDPITNLIQTYYLQECMPIFGPPMPNGISLDSLGNPWIDGRTGFSFIVNYSSSTGTCTNWSSYPISYIFYTGIIVDRQNNIWFSAVDYSLTNDYIALFSPSTGGYTEYSIPTPRSVPMGMALDSKGLIWFAESAGNNIGVLDPSSGRITEYPIPTPNSQTSYVALDSYDNVWFSEVAASKIGVIIRNPRLLFNIAMNDIVNATYLNPGNSYKGLLAKINAAIASYGNGDIQSAINSLDAFYNQLCAMNKSGQISADSYGLLYQDYSELVTLLGGNPKPQC